jgi:hypothetical protein
MDEKSSFQSRNGLTLQRCVIVYFTVCTSLLHSKFISITCTGAAYLARAGVLNSHRATTNKQAFGWVTTDMPGYEPKNFPPEKECERKTSTDPIEWVYHARWVDDGRVITSSGDSITHFLDSFFVLFS